MLVPFVPVPTYKVLLPHDMAFWSLQIGLRIVSAIFKISAGNCGQISAFWSSFIMWAEYAHNTLCCSATGMSPFECQFGYAPPLFLDQEVEVGDSSAQRFIRRCRLMWKKARHKNCLAAIPKTGKPQTQNCSISAACGFGSLLRTFP